MEVSTGASTIGGSPPPGTPQADLAVSVRELTVLFGSFCAVDHITFSVKRGEIFGFLGANGAGKTTTIRVLCGLLRPTSGDVRVAGLGFEKGELAIKSKVGYMSQKFTLYNDLTVEENLSFIASLRKLDPKTYANRRTAILDFISFQRALNAQVKDLPGGIKQQVSLAASLLHDPEIIFLDEPTAGVTPAARARFWNLIRSLAEKGKTLFVTTHYMDEAEQCDRIALMRDGKIIALDTPANLKRNIFPEPLFEVTPKFQASPRSPKSPVAGGAPEFKEVSYSELEALRHHSEIAFFEPYGLRFHASFKNTEAAEALKQQLSKVYHLKRIQPSLEDVFIRTVEARSTEEEGHQSKKRSQRKGKSQGNEGDPK